MSCVDLIYSHNNPEQNRVSITPRPLPDAANCAAYAWSETQNGAPTQEGADICKARTNPKRGSKSKNVLVSSTVTGNYHTNNYIIQRTSIPQRHVPSRRTSAKAGDGNESKVCAAPAVNAVLQSDCTSSTRVCLRSPSEATAMRVFVAAA